MRIRVKGVLDMLAAGATEAEILQSYPCLEREGADGRPLAGARGYENRTRNFRPGCSFEPALAVVLFDLTPMAPAQGSGGGPGIDDALSGRRRFQGIRALTVTRIGRIHATVTGTLRSWHRSQPD